MPRGERAGVVDEQLMPLLLVDGDTQGVELGVTVAATFEGTVTDPEGKPVENVVVHARQIEPPSRPGRPTATPVLDSARRPVLGTDTVISDDKGKFTLRVPAGRYELMADHAA